MFSSSASAGDAPPVDPITEFDKSPKILVVDDEALNLTLITELLRAEGYQHIATLSDPTKVIGELRRESYDILLLDIMMPHVSGLDILKTIKNDENLKRLPVIVLSALREGQMKSDALSLGAVDYLQKPFDQGELLLRLRNVLRIKFYNDWLADENKHLESLVKKKTRQIVQTRLEVIQRLAKVAEYRDTETGRHIIRVSMTTAILGRGMGLSEVRTELLMHSSPLHDVGKVAIQDSILLKPGPLTAEERQIMSQHTLIGYKMLCEMKPTRQALRSTLGDGATDEARDNPLIATSAMIALTHHERWDGQGYPFGIVGEDIPIEGRIVSLADIFDALQSKRPYKEAFPIERCYKIIRELSGVNLAPRIVESFFDHRDEINRVREEYADRDEVQG